MKKPLVIIVTVIILSLAYWLISPLLIDKKVSEEFPQGIVSEPVLYRSGTFTGFDSIHYGSGGVKVYKTDEGYVIRFEDNFNVANGPDLYVGLGRNGEYVEGAQLERLKGNIGSQNYVVPADINLEDYNEVWIWCRSFSVPFAKALLK